MESIAVSRPNMTVTGQESLSPFGLLTQVFTQELLQRNGQGIGSYRPLRLAYLEEEEPEEKAADNFIVRNALNYIEEHYNEKILLSDVADKVYVAGAKLSDGKLLTDGGRVLGCTAVADTLPNAIHDAYEIVSQVSFENAYYRHDIGARALRAPEG